MCFFSLKQMSNRLLCRIRYFLKSIGPCQSLGLDRSRGSRPQSKICKINAVTGLLDVRFIQLVDYIL